MAGSPRVSIGVMTFNNGRYLAGAFDAVLAQDFTDFEIVVCDNESTDATWEICERYAATDDRFRIFRNGNNLGVSGNFNRVVGLARGEFFRLTSHDDLMAPALLRRCVETLDANPRAVLAHPLTAVIDGDGNHVCDWDSDLDLREDSPTRRLVRLVGQWILCNELFGLVRTDVLRQTRLFAPFASTDKRLLVELAVRGEFHLIPERLFFRRIHDSTSFRTGRAEAPGGTYGWLEPEHAAKGAPTRYNRPHGDDGRLTWETTRALLGSDLPLPDRLRDGAAFATYWQYRRARIFAGRHRRRLMRVPIPPAPWDQPRIPR